MNRPVIAVTGATGFIGGRIVHVLLDAGYDVRALTRRAPPTLDSRVSNLTWINGTLDHVAALKELVAGVTSVVHCAGAIKAVSRAAFFEVNQAGTRRLAEIAAAQKNPPRFIHMSSLAAREPGLSPYAASKRAGEQALEDFRDPLRPIVLRPPIVYGPGDMETLRIFRFAERGIFPMPWGHTGRMSLVHVDDATRAVLAALQMPGDAVSALMEFDDGHPGGYGWAEIAAAAGAAVARRARVISVPKTVLRAAGLLGSLATLVTGRPDLINRSKVAEILHTDWVASGPVPAGYSPQWTIEKGFKNTVNWYASRGLLKSNG